MLTKSFSALAGLLVAVGVLAWRAARRIAARRLLVAGLALAVLLGGIVTAGLATGRLDALLLTQARRSLGYRWEYWQGTWGVITEGAQTLAGVLQSATFWKGVGCMGAPGAAPGARAGALEPARTGESAGPRPVERPQRARKALALRSAG
jgi:hypothetical protein